ncbi:MAG: hypothetical protein CR989_02015 [Flavobacteriales bacterium]|nr:MAG: hypothetical protein CR989_02015 [Flavobacteriales bacterium]
MKRKNIVLGMLSVYFITIGLSGYAQELSDNNSALIAAYFDNSSNVISQTKIFQNGNYNTSFIQTSPKENINIYQEGSFNGYFFISAYGKNDFNLNVIQQGKNNSIHIFGENSLMKNATIRQTGTNKDVIITNN